MDIKIHQDEKIFFISSSGHCSLDCSYCVATPIVKHQPSLVYDDFEFLLERVDGKAFFIFSGKGDFFAGYRKNDRLLERLLEHDNLNVALDINGVMIHEFGELSAARLEKIRHVNLSLHYSQLVANNALRAWEKNALTLLEKKDGADFFVNMVLSPRERNVWQEALSWYEDKVFKHTGKKIILICDALLAFEDEDSATVAQLKTQFDPLIGEFRQGSFANCFKQFDYVRCPAGRDYFRVWNDGAVQGCPYIAEVADCGNLKARKFTQRQGLIECADAKYCDCYHIASAGKMEFRSKAMWFTRLIDNIQDWRNATPN
ncbi:MAG: radical SAM protein [Sulfuricellaceae bacterium]